MPQYADHQFFVDHTRDHGLPSPDLPLAVREAYTASGLPIPSVRVPLMGVTTPPGPGYCGHCGTPVPEGQHRRAHAVAAFEHLRHPDGTPARLPVDHCDACVGGDGCDRNVAGGFCEEVDG